MDNTGRWACSTRLGLRVRPKPLGRHARSAVWVVGASWPIWVIGSAWPILVIGSSPFGSPGPFGSWVPLDLFVSSSQSSMFGSSGRPTHLCHQDCPTRFICSVCSNRLCCWASSNLFGLSGLPSLYGSSSPPNSFASTNLVSLGHRACLDRVGRRAARPVRLIGPTRFVYVVRPTRLVWFVESTYFLGQIDNCTRESRVWGWMRRISNSTYFEGIWICTNLANWNPSKKCLRLKLFLISLSKQSISLQRNLNSSKKWIASLKYSIETHS